MSQPLDYDPALYWPDEPDRCPRCNVIFECDGDLLPCDACTDELTREYTCDGCEVTAVGCEGQDFHVINPNSQHYSYTLCDKCNRDALDAARDDQRERDRRTYGF